MNPDVSQERSPRTFGSEDRLPRVPLPRLEDTVAPPFAAGVTWTVSLPSDVSMMNRVPFR